MGIHRIAAARRRHLLRCRPRDDSAHSVVGLRVPALTRSEDAWRSGHAAGQVPALVSFVVALVFSMLGLASPLAYWGTLAVFLGGLTWIVIRASSAANAA